jgi:hypothetical protein
MFMLLLVGEGPSVRVGLERLHAEGLQDLGASAGDLGLGRCPVGAWQVDLPGVRDPALVHQDHAVGERECLVDVVGDQQHRHPVAPPELDDELVHVDAGQRVESAEGLVEQQQ